MQEYQQRVIDEQEELCTKADKLGSFMETAAFRALDNKQRHLLSRQINAMSEYSTILAERIVEFN